jgi:hypothetical protein
MRTRALVIVAAASLVLAGCGSGPEGPADAGSRVTAASTSTASTSIAIVTGSPVVPAGGLVPLWPFTSVAQAEVWQASFRTGGQEPWHLDVEQTALSFTRSRLGYGEVDRVTSRSVHGADARIGVGWSVQGEATATVAVLHLIRLGAGQDAPWVVVGTDDGRLVLDRPGYGSTATSPLRIGGEITGVDESLHVKVLASTSAIPLGEVHGIPAGGEHSPWSATVDFSAPAGTLLIVAVSTGGHLKDVEQFAVTAVRAG